MYQHNYIIVGSGLAGLYAAYKASRHGTVAIITKTGIRESNSYYAQGGIAAVTDTDDSPLMHFEDTIVAGRGLCDYDSVRILVNEGPQRIRELIEDGMHFDMEDGSLALGLEGGHHKRRILHAGGDITGKVITDFMIRKVTEQPNIEFFENHSAIELIVSPDNVCHGLRAWDIANKREKIFTGEHTFLTLGGTSAIYKRTTNPETTVGDGIAIAYRAGCIIQNMEFIQFHPSAIYMPTGEAYLISEAVRGEGAYLLNEKGERFMTELHELAELAPRDIVAQSIYREIKKQKNPFVYLSLKHIDPERIKKRFPNIYEKCKSIGLDMTDKIPVAPAAHYTVGGVKTDGYGRTNIARLYACGEMAYTGIMGANRLASNSLIECLVFGNRAVSDSVYDKPETTVNDIREKFTYDENNKETYLKIKNDIAEIMTKYAGIIRNESGLEKGLALLEETKRQIKTRQDEYFSVLSKNLITVSELIMRAALYRKESRGGHYREDHPHPDPNYCFHTIQQINHPITTMPVITDKTMNEKQLIDKLIDLAIEEDIHTGDITTEAIIPKHSRGVAEMKMKADGVIAGMDIAKFIFEKFDNTLVWTPYVQDGDKVKKGDVILRIEARFQCLLSGERTALNIMQRMSGIATMTSLYVAELKGFKTKLLDTRKTAPGMRVLDKMAVKAGGGENHRMGLFDLAMIKDNHIKAAGGIKEAVKQVRTSISPDIKIEVETTNIEEVREAVAAGADIIMLDNMDNPTMADAVRLIAGRADTEASGNMNMERLKEVAATGVDYISVGALTHSVKSLDISMNILNK